MAYSLCILKQVAGRTNPWYKCLENEYHFLLKCKAYDETRDEFFQVLVDNDVEVDTSTEAGFVKCILGKDALRTTGKYLEKMYKERREKLNVK